MDGLAPSTGARGRWAFHRYPLCEPIRFLGRDRCLLHSYGNEDSNDGYLHSDQMRMNCQSDVLGVRTHLDRKRCLGMTLASKTLLLPVRMASCCNFGPGCSYLEGRLRVRGQVGPVAPSCWLCRQSPRSTARAVSSIGPKRRLRGVRYSRRYRAISGKHLLGLSFTGVPHASFYH